MDGAIIVDESPKRRRGRRSVKRSTRRRAKFRRGPSGCRSDHGGGISGHAKHAHEAATHVFGCQTGDVAVCDGQGDHFSDGEGYHHDDQNRHTGADEVEPDGRTSYLVGSKRERGDPDGEAFALKVERKEGHDKVPEAIDEGATEENPIASR